MAGVIFIGMMILCAIVNSPCMAEESELFMPEEYFTGFTSLVVNDAAENPWSPAKPATGPSWTAQKQHQMSGFTDSPNDQSPVIMMAGYMDTDISWRNGGIFRMLAWVWDPDDDIVSVEIFYEGEPTGVFLLDDGLSGDFDAGDSLYGLTVEIASNNLQPGDYVLELRASDTLGNLSDLWPYLTIHD